MNVHQKTIDATAAQSSLDLAVVGNGRTAALVNPLARIVWWCFPRFDGDPVFCRLLAGDEEKGFTDVVLDRMVTSHSEYVRNTAIVTTLLTDASGASVRITDFAPRFSHFGRTYRAPQLMRIIEPVAGLPRITIRFRPDPRSRQVAHGSRVRQQPYPLHRRRCRDPSDHRRAARLRRPRVAVRADPPGHHGVRRRRAVRGRTRAPPAASSASARATTGSEWMQAAQHRLRVAGRGDPRGDHAQALRLRGDRRDHRRAHNLGP